MFYIFDLDGTLVDSLEDIGNAINYALEDCNFPTHSQDKLRTFIGNGSRNFVMRSLGIDNSEAFDRVFEKYAYFYGIHCLEHVKLYPGVEDFIKKNKGNCAVLTNKHISFSVKILDFFGLMPYFTGVLGGDNAPAPKPSPEGLFNLVKAAGRSLDEVVMVGDDTPDIGVAKAAGVKSAALLCGYGKKNDLLALNPDYTFQSFEEFSIFGGYGNS